MIAPSISSEIIHHRTPRRVKAIVDRILLEAVLRCGHRGGSRLLFRRTLNETAADAGTDQWSVGARCKVRTRVAANGGVPAAHACAVGCNGGVAAAHACAVGCNGGVAAAHACAVGCNGGVPAAHACAVGCNGAAPPRAEGRPRDSLSSA